MTKRHVHYERAFEHYLRANRLPYVAIDEARKTLLPESAALDALKSFDFLVYARDRRLIVDVKGRRYRGGRRFENWVTRDDVESLTTWEAMLGDGFEAAFVFIYALDAQPPDALFECTISHGDVWYALREATLRHYMPCMRRRSDRWLTVDVPTASFASISRPLHLEPPV
ncbi:MAG: HYExAFE family protein [Planctomycetota bacterium]